MKKICLLVVLLATAIIARAQQLDPSVNYGKLSNGLTYYLAKNDQPSDQVIIYLVVRAGSALEKEDQSGLAHFVEHMAYNGTTHFPGNGVVEYIQKKGLTHGIHSNAKTGEERTLYYFKIPVHDTQVVDSCLLALKDFAQDMTMDSIEIDAERGVVLGEMDLFHKSKDTRLKKQYLSIVSNHSRYVDRSPIGTEYNLKHFKHTSLKQFYHDWYRPDLMAVIIVGDIDTSSFQKKIQNVFGPLKSIEPAPKWQEFPSRLDNKNKYVAATDPEQENVELIIYNKFLQPETKKTNDLRNDLLYRLYNQIMEQRLPILGESFDSKLISATSNIRPLIYQSHLSAIHSACITQPPFIESGFKSIYRELLRFKQFGCTTAELKSARAAVKKELQKEYTNTTENIIQHIEYHFVFGKMFPGHHRLKKISDSLLNAITVKELNQTIKRLIDSKNRDIVLMAPDSVRPLLPREYQINDWIKEVEREKLSPFVYAKIPEKLINEKLLPALPEEVITGFVSYPAIGADETIFPNGMRVILKPIPSADGKIAVRAYSKGGTITIPQLDSLTDNNLPFVIGDIGVGELNKFQLRKYLAHAGISLTPEIQRFYEGFTGSADTSSFRQLVQLMYLYFTAPVFPEKAVESRLASAGKEISPEKFTRSMYEGFDIFKKRFASPGDFTFIVTGDFSRNDVLNDFTRYLSFIPGKRLPVKYNYAPLNKNKTTILYEGAEDVARVSLIYEGQIGNDPKNNLYINALTDIIYNRCQARLREKESLSYAPLVYGNFADFPVPNFNIYIAAYCNASYVDRLINAAVDEITMLKSEGPSDMELQKTKNKLLSENNRIMTSNDPFAWNYYLALQLTATGDMEDVVNSTTAIQQLTAEQLREFAKSILTEANTFKVITYPVKYQK